MAPAAVSGESHHATVRQESGIQKAAMEEIATEKISDDKPTITLLRVFSRLPTSSPYIGVFHYAPSGSNGNRSFFEGQLIPEEEMERLRKVRVHPLTGNFHSRPGHYSKLHGLKKFSPPTGADDMMGMFGFYGGRGGNFATSQRQRREFIRMLKSSLMMGMGGVLGDPYSHQVHLNPHHHMGHQPGGHYPDIDGSAINLMVSPTSSKSVRKSYVGPPLLLDSGGGSGSGSTMNGTGAGSAGAGGVDGGVDGGRESREDSTEVALRGTHMHMGEPLIGGVTTMMRHFYHMDNKSRSSTVSLSSEGGEASATETEAAAAAAGPLTVGVGAVAGAPPGANSPSPVSNTRSASGSSSSSSTSDTRMSPKGGGNAGRGTGYERHSPSHVVLDRSLMSVNLESAAVTQKRVMGPPNPNSIGAPLSSSPPMGSVIRPSPYSSSYGHTVQANTWAAQQQRGWESHTLNAQEKTDAFLQQKGQLEPDMQPHRVEQKNEMASSYELQEGKGGILGQGAYSTVRAGVHRATGRLVAVKIINKRYLFSDAEKACIERERENQQRLIHPHVVRLFQVYETPETLCLVMERCTHGTLAEMLAVRGRLKELECKRIVKQMLEGVQFIHDSGVVHCDLKPENICFLMSEEDKDKQVEANGGGGTDDEGYADPPWCDASSSMSQQLMVKLCDFGHSRKVPDARYFKYTGDIHKIPFHLFKHTGTEGYVAPEILEAQPYGKKADIWSVGVMAYRMLSGRMPWLRSAASQSQPLNMTGIVWDKVSKEAKALVKDMLNKDQNGRQSAQSYLNHEWFDMVDHCAVMPTTAPIPISSSSSSANSPLMQQHNSPHQRQLFQQQQQHHHSHHHSHQPQQQHYQSGSSRHQNYGNYPSPQPVQQYSNHYQSPPQQQQQQQMFWARGGGAYGYGVSVGLGRQPYAFPSAGGLPSSL